MCWWIFGHCWHKVANSERKLRYDGKCKLHNPFTCEDRTGKYIMVGITEVCCLCRKYRYACYKEYNLKKADKYAVVENNDVLRGVH